MMIATSGFLQFMVMSALSLTVLTPVVLLILWIKDWIRKELW